MLRVAAIVIALFLPCEPANARPTDKLILSEVTTWTGDHWESWGARYFLEETHFVMLPWGGWFEYEAIREVTRWEWLETELPGDEDDNG